MFPVVQIPPNTSPTYPKMGYESSRDRVSYGEPAVEDILVPLLQLRARSHGSEGQSILGICTR